MIKLQLECSEEAMKMLDELVIEAKASHAVIVRRALSLYKFLSDLQARKGVIKIIEENNKSYELDSLMKNLLPKCFLLKTQEPHLEASPKNGQYFTSKELKEFISTKIEIIQLKNHKILIVDKEGKRKKLTVNHAATRLVKEMLQMNDQIVGDALYCDSRMIPRQ